MNTYHDPELVRLVMYEIKSLFSERHQSPPGLPCDSTVEECAHRIIGLLDPDQK